LLWFLAGDPSVDIDAHAMGGYDFAFIILKGSCY
jgi:hypothetical protein